MSGKVKSARGVDVDFDLLKIKEQIASAAPTQDIRAREEFIEKKLHRRIRKGVYKKAQPKVAPVSVDPVMPEGAVTNSEALAAVDVTPAPAKAPLKQKAR